MLKKLFPRPFDVTIWGFLLVLNGRHWTVQECTRLLSSCSWKKNHKINLNISSIHFQLNFLLDNEKFMLTMNLEFKQFWRASFSNDCIIYLVETSKFFYSWMEIDLLIITGYVMSQYIKRWQISHTLPWNPLGKSFNIWKSIFLSWHWANAYSVSAFGCGF